MAEVPQKPDRFNPAMPRIPGVTDQPREPGEASGDSRLKQKLTWRLGAAVVAAVALASALAWWALRSPGPAASGEAQGSPHSPAGAGDPAARPDAPRGPVKVATLAELASPWSSKRFFFRSPRTNEAIPAIVVRLPVGPAQRSASYWAFSLQAPFGRCELEYETHLEKLARQYGYRAAHPMVADPCSGTLYDPLRLGTLSSGVWARGEVVHGSGFRPPFAIEIQIQGNHLLATQIE